MYYLTKLDREKLEYAHLGGFEFVDEALIDGQLLIRECGIWKPSPITRAQQLTAAIHQGKLIRERWTHWIECCRTN